MSKPDKYNLYRVEIRRTIQVLVEHKKARGNKPEEKIYRDEDLVETYHDQTWEQACALHRKFGGELTCYEQWDRTDKKSDIRFRSDRKHNGGQKINRDAFAPATKPAVEKPKSEEKSDSKDDLSYAAAINKAVEREHEAA